MGNLLHILKELKSQLFCGTTSKRTYMWELCIKKYTQDHYHWALIYYLTVFSVLGQYIQFHFQFDENVSLYKYSCVCWWIMICLYQWIMSICIILDFRLLVMNVLGYVWMDINLFSAVHVYFMDTSSRACRNQVVIFLILELRI